MTIQVTTGMNQPTTLRINESVRYHMTKAGKTLAIPYTTTVAGTRYPFGLLTYADDTADMTDLQFDLTKMIGVVLSEHGNAAASLYLRDRSYKYTVNVA